LRKENDMNPHGKQILFEVSTTRDLLIVDVVSRKKSLKLSAARAECCFRMFQETEMSNGEIADIMNMSDISSVIYQIRNWRQRQGDARYANPMMNLVA